MIHRAALLAFALVLSSATVADDHERYAEKASEYRLKAALIYSIAKFVFWPEGEIPRGEVGVCVLGADPFGESLDELASRNVRDLPVRVYRKINIGSLERDCAIVFVSASERLRIDLIVERLKGLPVLTIGDVSGFADAGGMIEFSMRDSRVGFEINVDASDNSRIRINSQLLQVAARVIRRERA